MKVDIHIHSNLTDGALSLEQIVDISKKFGLDVIAVAEHDTIEHIKPLEELCRKAGLRAIPAIEITTCLDDYEIHILGYNIDYQNQKLVRALQTSKQEAEKRLLILLDKLQSLGIHISPEEVRLVAKNRALTRKFVARAIARKGYCAKSSEAFSWYLAQGAPAYVQLESFTPQDAISLIKSVNGIPVLAHPSLLKNQAIINHLSKDIVGIEVFSKYADTRQWEEYLKMAKMHNLVITGGSDFHGEPIEPDIAFGMITLPLCYWLEFEKIICA